LTFAFESSIDLVQARDPEQRDLLLYLPDSIYVVDQDKRDAWHVKYNFSINQKLTQGMERVGGKDDFTPFQEGQAFQARDTPQGEYANSCENAKQGLM
jgi:anthranilate synthase